MPKDDIIIKIEHLTKVYDGKKVLDDISFNVRRGEFVTLLGPSGCGKTTLLRQIAGFVNPDEGKILMEDKDLCGIPPYKRPLNTVFQRYALFPHLDVYDNVAFGLKLSGTTEAEIDKRVRKMLKLVSMTDYEDRDVESLSGGQQQRVAIARSLAGNPQVLLLDEPLAALDLKMRKDMQIELKEMHKKLGITFIYVTHDQEEALTLSDTIIVLNEGKIQQIGSPADIYNEPVNPFVADFIGESNILAGTMVCDRKVNFIGHDFECVDEGFGEGTPVDVVIRPEDIYIMSKLDAGQFTGKVTSCTFKGVHYEMFVQTDEGYELMIQDYNAFEPGTEVSMLIKPQDIQVMRKERVRNTFEGKMLSDSHVSILDADFECKPCGLTAGDEVIVDVEFKAIDIMDHMEDGCTSGCIQSLLYMGDHYHVTILTESGEHVWADTNDIWDKGDLVGINIATKDLKIRKKGDD